MCDRPSWGYKEVMKLISLLRERPILWDNDNPNFRNKFQRELALDEISFAMNTTNNCIKNKIHTMRSQYLVEYKKLKSKERLKPIWQYFNNFKFIFKHDDVDFESLGTSDDTNPLNTSDDEGSNPQYYDDDSAAIRYANDTEHINIAVLSENNAENKIESLKLFYESDEDLPRKRCRLTDADEQISELEDKSEKGIRKKASTTTCDIRDEFIIFGENIATELRLLREHRSIHDELKSKILRAIKEAKYAIHKAKHKI